MTSNKMQFVSAFDDGFKVLGLPYKQGEDTRMFSMYIFLPDDQDGLPSLIEKVCLESGFIEDHLPYQLVELNEYRIPKFKIALDFEASGVLEGQGLELPFRPIGGFTEMVDSVVGDDLYVSQIFQKAFIEVNETGTEVAAVTANAMAMSCPTIRSEKVDIVADHPFLFIIREDTTGVVLFVGQPLNPLAG